MDGNTVFQTCSTIATYSVPHTEKLHHQEVKVTRASTWNVPYLANRWS